MTYIFLTSSIVRTGGAELYISRKVNHLIDLGWDVHVFSVHKNEIIIDNLKRYEEEINEILGYRIVSTHPIIRQKFLSFVRSKINCRSKIIIESHLLNFALWGEYLAKNLHAVNIYYDLNENQARLEEKYFNFIKFKYEQNCLYGITKHTIPLMGLEDSKNQTHLRAVGGTSNVIEDISFDIPKEIDTAEYKILSFGNLGKNYISNMVDEIIEFALKHKDKTIGVILSGHTEGNSSQINHKYKLDQISNINTMLVPMMLPVPQKLFEVSDVCIACSGSSHISSSVGLPTITVDVLDYNAIGVLHETTENNIYRVNEPQLKISDLLEEILINKRYEKKCYHYKQNPIDYSNHDKLLCLNTNNDYYDISKMSNWKNIIAQYINLIFGYDTVTKIVLSLLKTISTQFRA